MDDELRLPPFPLERHHRHTMTVSELRGQQPMGRRAQPVEDAGYGMFHARTPPLATEVIDKSGIELVRAWIEALR